MFGAGPNSTAAFTDKIAFPDVLEITSYENNKDWYKKVVNLTMHDKRVNLKLVEGSISQVMPRDISKYDLIFIDDSLTVEERAKTIKAINVLNPKMLVIHDYENKPYRDAAKKIGNLFWFKSLLPNTGVYIEEKDTEKLIHINRIIKKHKFNISNNDLLAWKTVFSREL